MPNPLCDYAEGKILENVDFKCFSNRASFLGNPLA